MRYDAGKMSATKLAAIETDVIRRQVNRQLEPRRKSALGQFMTPSAIADFMAGLFSSNAQNVRLLDAGAGIGSLSIAAVRKFGAVESVDAWELDPFMRLHLKESLATLGVAHNIHAEDFIESAVRSIALNRGTRFSHAILNPPYKKLNSNSIHRALLRKVGIETVNLYAAFVALSVLLMEKGGEVVAIIPRSFCNGPYYRPFRDLILGQCSLDRLHIFDSRDKAFADDEVLQENVIIKAVKGKVQGTVVVSRSHDHQLTDYTQRYLSFGEIVKPADQQAFIHVPVDEPSSAEWEGLFHSPLEDVGLEVCTGPVVDFRLKENWLTQPMAGSVPLLYPHHFASGRLEYPKVHRKPNALQNNPDVQKWLMPNERYVLVKRFSSKEERRRVVAYVYDPLRLDVSKVGFENHWNVFHCNKHGLDEELAYGLACFLNSTPLDQHFRIFSGHTQVNATDLKNMKYPNATSLRRLGRRYRIDMSQSEIDAAVLGEHGQRREDSPSQSHSH